MKKKILSLLLICTIMISFTACGGASDTAKNEPEDLTGTWTQANSSSEDSYQEATITDNTIEIYWISDGGDTESLYWAGTFTAPTEPGEYSWTSENDKEKTEFALLASNDDTKEFTYKDGVISYKASALGTTKTIKLEKKEDK